MTGEKYTDLLDYRLKQAEKTKAVGREASSFYIVTSNKNRKESKYYSFEEIPIEIRYDKKDYEILKIRYELRTRRTPGASRFVPRIATRTGYSYYEKLLYRNLIKRGYDENQNFKHLHSIEDSFGDRSYILDFAFLKEKLAVEIDGEIWHERCRNHEEEKIKELYLLNNGWKVLRFNFKVKDLKNILLNALRKIDSEIKK